MYAVIKTGGKQYTVKEGQSLKIDDLNVDEGASVEFDQVLLVNKDGAVQVGKPFVEGAKVSATVDRNGRGKKITIIKFRRRKDSRLKKGHRQPFTQVTIDSIQA